MARYYFDTSIWIDYFEDRVDKFRPLGEFAFQLLKKIYEEGDVVLFSELVLFELEERYSRQKVSAILEAAKEWGVLACVPISIAQRTESKRISEEQEVPRADALHAILARDNRAILVTRDSHFLHLTSIVDVKKPEEIL
jgi:predicted nucleic acid-binding protein